MCHGMCMETFVESEFLSWDQTCLSDFIVILMYQANSPVPGLFCGVGRDSFNILFTPCKKPLKTLTAYCFI